LDDGANLYLPCFLFLAASLLTLSNRLQQVKAIPLLQKLPGVYSISFVFYFLSKADDGFILKNLNFASLIFGDT
jgi:hypothetical protein